MYGEIPAFEVFDSKSLLASLELMNWETGFGLSSSKLKSAPQLARDLCFFPNGNETPPMKLWMNRNNFICAQIPRIMPNETNFISILNEDADFGIHVLDFISHERQFVFDVQTILVNIFGNANNEADPEKKISLNETKYSEIEKYLSASLTDLMNDHKKFLFKLEEITKSNNEFLPNFIQLMNVVNKETLPKHKLYIEKYMSIESTILDFSAEMSSKFLEVSGGRVLVQLLSVPATWQTYATVIIKSMLNTNLCRSFPQYSVVLASYISNTVEFSSESQILPSMELLSKRFISEPFPLGEPGRYLIKIGKALKLCKKQNDIRQLILLSDYFITAKTISGKYVDPDCYKLQEIMIEKNDSNLFLIIYSPKQSFVLEFELIGTLNEWFNAINDAIQSLTDNTKPTKRITYAPIWVQDKDAPLCMNCNTQFTVINRRHHCRVCGKVLCKKCLPYKIKIPIISPDKPEKVCQKCYDKLQED